MSVSIKPLPGKVPFHSQLATPCFFLHPLVFEQFYFYHRSSLFKSRSPPICLSSFGITSNPKYFTLVQLSQRNLCVLFEMPSTHYNRVNVIDLLNHDSYPFNGHPLQQETGQQTHSNQYVCNIGECTRRFSSEKALTSHFEKAHGSSTQYICPHCRSSFSTSPNLNKHVSHTLLDFSDSF